jgi:hypothetical protein
LLLSGRHHFPKHTEIRDLIFPNAPSSTYLLYLHHKIIKFRWKFKETCIKTTHSHFCDPCYACYMVRDCLLNPFCFIIIACHVNLYILVSFRRSNGISPCAVPSETRTFKLFLLYFLMPISITIISHVPNRNLTDFVRLM